MKKRKLKNNKTYQKIAFWLGVVVLGSLLGAVIQFGRAWVEPSASAPDGNIAAPIYTAGTTQTKIGGDICVDMDSDGVNDKCLSDSESGVAPGTVLMWSGSMASIPSGWILCDGSNGTPDMRSRFVYGVNSSQEPGTTGNFVKQVVTSVSMSVAGSVTVGNVSIPYLRVAYIMKQPIGWTNTDLVGEEHNQTDCAAAGGTFIASGNFCKFTAGSCPSDWTQYSNWRTTSAKTCDGTNGTKCTRATSCTTGEHDFADSAVETCSYVNDRRLSRQVWNPTYWCQNILGGSLDNWYLYDACRPTDETNCYWNGDSTVCQPSCVLDTNNTYGCGTTTTQNYCSTQNVTCTADVLEVGCY